MSKGKRKKVNLKTQRATEARMTWLLYGKNPALTKQALIHLMKGNNGGQDEG